MDPTPPRRRSGNWMRRAALVAAAFLAGEICITIVARLHPRLDATLGAFDHLPHTVPDDKLGHRPHPARPGHDQNGFRNRGVPESVHLVAIGDSQTYGEGVRARDAWPADLARRSGRSVYSMACGGYGATHYLELCERALVLNPDTIVVGVYAGNDLYDAFNHVYNEQGPAELRTTDPDRLAELEQEEAVETIAQRVSSLYRGGATTEAPPPEARWMPGTRLYRLTSRAIYDLYRRGRGESGAWRDARAFARNRPTFCYVPADAAVHTVFTPAYRLCALNLADPRIAEGFRITREALLGMHRLCTQHETRLVVVLIPTKERVYAPLLGEGQPDAFAQLVRNEEQFADESTRFLTRHGITCVDPLVALRAQVKAGPAPYRLNEDGHPTATGHRVIAEAIAAIVATRP